MFGLTAFMDALRTDRRVWPLLLLICCTMIGSALVVPMLSLYAQTFGVSATLVGMLVTIFGVGRIVANFPSGWLSQRLGRRPLLALGPAITAVGAVGAAITGDFYWLLFWRFVQGVGSGMYQTVSLAALADVSTPQTRARVVGLYQVALQFGASIGPLIGGYIAKYFGLRAPFWALLLIAAVTCILALATFRDTKADQGPARSMSGALGRRRGLSSPAFLSISLVSAIMFFARTACMFQLMPLMGVDKFGLDVGHIGLSITIIAFAMLVVLPSASLLCEKMGSRFAVLLSCVLTIFGIGLVLAGSHPAWFWLSMTVYGLASGINSAAVGTFTIEVLPRHKYGEGMGLQRTISDIGYVTGPVFAGVVSDLSGYGNAGGIVATLVMIALAALVFALGSARSGAGAPASPRDGDA
ncbi:MAG: MFS transporter [Beijerinckiaceae bacterium]